MELINFLNENYYVLVPVLWVIGYALKQTPKIPDWTIIWFLLGISLVIGTIAFGFSIDGIFNGIIAAGVAVLGHQMFKQTVGVRNNTKKDERKSK
ncbi:phage holin family protein [Robertmurraya sp. Marseille-Q9965]